MASSDLCISCISKVGPELGLHPRHVGNCNLSPSDQGGKSQKVNNNNQDMRLRGRHHRSPRCLAWSLELPPFLFHLDCSSFAPSARHDHCYSGCLASEGQRALGRIGSDDPRRRWSPTASSVELIVIKARYFLFWYEAYSIVINVRASSRGEVARQSLLVCRSCVLSSRLLGTPAGPESFFSWS